MGTNITGIGNANAIGFKSRVTGGTYFPPELKDALVGVWSVYGKSNDSTDRNIIKNKIKDRGGDFVISNAAFKLNSGFGKYEEDFTSWDRIDASTAEISNDGSKIKCINTILNVQYLFNSINKDIPSFKVKISNFTKGNIAYYYRKEDGTEAFLRIEPSPLDKVLELPKSYNTVEGGTGSRGGFYSSNINIGVTIEQIPSFEGAFVTDGVDDLITSTKTVQEMGITDEITVVSMIHKISSDNNWTNLIGELKEDHTFVANRATNTDKTGIYGYTYNYVGDAIVINNILGDKNDYIVRTSTSLGLDNKYYVTGFRSAGIIQNISQIAWYWTFIANRVLTTDEINLVIEKYNLDRPGEIVKPQVYYDIKRQKITNENHSAFDDKLIDYSGNGYDAKLYNFGWKEDSGIGKYETDFTDWKKSFKVTSFDSESIKFTSDVSWVLLYHPSSIGEDIPSFKVRIKLYGKGTLYYNYITQEGKYTNVAVKSEIFETPICYNTKYTGEKGVNVGFTLGVTSGECSGTITQIPEYENALVLDGVDDYGKVTGLPILKDYTVAADYIRTFAKESAQDSPILSKSKVAGSGAFLFNYLNADSITSSYSFGTNNILKEINDSERKIYYLSKYASDGHNVNAGSAVDYDTMWLGTYKDNINNFFTGALYFAMLFPYSLSEFLLERQIKKARAGTLYSNQVKFRPIIPEDENITRIDYFVVDSGIWKVIKPGDYVDVGARIVLNVYTKLPYKIAGASSTAFTGMTVGPSTALNIWDVKGYIKDKTPQKIKLTLAVNEDIVQWNPAITSNLLDSFTVSSWYLNGWDNTLTVGTWIKKTDRVFFKATFKTELYGLETATFGGTECVVSKANNWSDSKNIWDIRMLGTVGDLSQVFNLDVYELIRFEDIVQPYPVLLRFKDENGNEVSWGGKFRVGSTITRIGSAADSNLLPNIYNIFGLLLNGNQVTSSKVIVEKTMVFKAKSAYIFDNNEPKCILSPRLLRIPNSSYKILGYIPDISGHGNHGVIHNSAYAEGSGVNEDGSYQFDGVDDFVAIPTLSSGGKQVLMKVNLPRLNEIIYDQRKEQNTYTFAILTTPSQIAYDQRNSERITYIDGILNTNIIAEQLMGVTHNIVVINSKANLDNTRSPILGRDINGNNWSRMRIYDFMLFDGISTDDKIKELNEYVGIEGNVFEFNPMFTIDLPMAIKNIKVYQGGNEISPGYLYPNKDTEFEVYVSLNDGKYAVDTITVDGVEITKDRVVGEYNIFKFILNGSSEQKIKIHSYEYIMYEDINQPYPVIFKVKDRTTNQIYSWGDRIKIGSSIQLINGENPNLLPELYSIISYTYEGNSYSYNQLTNLVITVTKTISVSCQKTWKLGSNEPKCILSPKRLKLANSSYKYLGYIPDISGNGNNGVFNNFEFAGMSGVDGYPFNFRTITVLVKKVSFTDDTLVINRTSTSDQIWVLNLGKQSESFDLYVNWEDDSTRLLVWAKNGIIVSQYTLNKEWNSIPVVTDDYDYIYLSYINPSTLGKTTIKQKAKYEGSICFDGVDDYITIPTLSEGGKQVLMKVNWQKQDTMLYNQNPGQDNFAIFTNDYNNNNLVVAYASRNNGNTYIDGVVNNNILATQLKGITHNIVATNNNIDATITPIIGSNKNHDNFFAQMALYDFMLFDEISTDEEIKELNNIVGIEGDYVQKPSYYWDAYGKSNLDVDKGYIKDQVSLQLNNDTTNNNSLENFNFGYEGMSGYNGYPVIFGANKTWKNKAPEGPNSYICTINANKYNITQILLSNAWTYSYIKENGELTKYNKDVESFKIKVTGLKSEIPLRYFYLSSTDATVTSNITIESDGTYELPKSFANDGSLIDNYGWIGFDFTRISVDIPEIITDVNITIEILPEYKNGLVYDGVDDYSENASIPLLSDYTYIFKRTLLNKKYNSASIFKGSNQQSGGAFICDYNSVEPDLLTQGYSFGAGLYVDSLNADSIVYGTRGSVNGTKITAGNNTDTEGLTVGKWRAYKEMVFYKLFLYPRTVNMLSINMVKNMMEEDGIIDLTSKLFTDKYTGDFYEMDFNNDFLIGN